MPHGNRNMSSRMTEICWRNTNDDIVSENNPNLTSNTMPFDQTYNVEPPFYSCLELVYEILEDLEDIRIALEKGRDPSFFLFPNLGFDPFKTIGKY